MTTRTAACLALGAALSLTACLIKPQPRSASYDPEPGPTASSQPTSAAPAAPAAPAPAAPAVVSVTIRNTCHETVKVFYGDKPKFGSGTYSTLSGNSVTSKQMRAGDMLWIVDDSQQGLSSATVSAGTRTIEVTEQCAGLTSR